MLAERLGKTIGEIERMPGRELLEWMAFDRIKQKPSSIEMSPDAMLAEAKRMTAGANG